jgi:pyrimidine operon attenuation protein/uracil phosphoribosyltransferase
MGKNYILDAGAAEIKLRRMAFEILENNEGEQGLILVGIRENGLVIAEILSRLLLEINNTRSECISLSLDKRFPTDVQLSQTPNCDGRVLILVDDVSNTGKTLLYALKPFLTFHPKKIQSLVMVDRTHKLFPVRPSYVGLSVATTLQEHIFVEVDGLQIAGAWLE